MPATISTLTAATAKAPVQDALHAQVSSVLSKTTRSDKPFLELTLVDATQSMKLRVWSDNPSYPACESLKDGQFVAVEGEFYQNGTFGMDAKNWQLRLLAEDEIQALLGGPEELRSKQEHDYQSITSLIDTIVDPRIGGVCAAFISQFGERFQRTAAARTYHHARRGGLVEHVAQMMRSAAAIAEVYPALNRDLLIAGALLHDCGKLWENCTEEQGFAMPFMKSGELLGHITIGIELVNHLYRAALQGPQATEWKSLQPSNEDVRLHLLHLIASHHGELQFGSPVEPRTPEAVALHYIDNLDAKLEMLYAGYPNATEVAPQIYERIRPLPGHPVAPLAKFPHS